MGTTRDTRSRGTLQLVGLTAILMLVLVALPATPAAAHGDCGFTRDGAPGSSTWSRFNDDRSKVLGFTRFHCIGNEQHDRTFVHIRLFRCVYGHGASFGCSTTLNFIKGDTLNCYDAAACIVRIEIGNPCTNSWYRYVAFGRWAAFNESGVRVHQSPGWPDLVREKPAAFGLPTIGTYCG